MIAQRIWVSVSSILPSVEMIDVNGVHRRHHDAELEEWLIVIETKTFDPSREELRIAGRILNDHRGRYPHGNG